jgi:phage terminase small subunit
MPDHETAKPLAARQQRFVEEYLLDLNGKHAAIRAGYSPRTAEVQAAQFLRIPKVQAEVSAAQARRSQRTAITQDSVLREIGLLAQSDMTHYHIDDYGNLALRAGAPADAMRAVASLRKKILHTEQGILYETEIKLWNKPTAVRMAGEHLGLFKGAEPTMPDIHIHLHTARERLADRLGHLATRHAQDAVNGA